jgi:hypothetical protein
VFDHFWDFDRLVEHAVPRWSGERRISFILQTCGPNNGFTRVYVMG